MFRNDAAANRLAVYLFFMVLLVLVPKADVPDTPFDEASTPTNEMVVEKAAPSTLYGPLIAAYVPRMFAPVQSIGISRVVPLCTRRLIDSRSFRKLLCTLLC